MTENPEQAKYEQMWGLEQYRRYAPGEHLVSDFILHVDPPPGAKIIDFGAGTGRGAYALAQSGFDVHMLDFAPNSLDPEVANAVVKNKLTLTQHDLLKPSPIRAEYGYCTDVMEHIQPEYVDQVLDNILDAAEKVFFQISLEDDACGALINEHLHLTVETMEWWMAKMSEHKAFVYYSEKRGENALFYVSRLEDADYVELNVELEVLEKQIRHNTAQGYTQCVPHRPQARPCMLLGGGPSLADYEDAIRQRASDGVPVICTNGAYNWCLSKGISPNGLIVVDARPNNAKFVAAAEPDCKYLFASQCHPSLFDAVPRKQVWLWHSHAEGMTDDLLNDIYPDEPWYSVPGGTTVMLRAIPLLGMLGWKNQHIYGFDSCLRNGEHHAYPQDENEGYKVHDVTVGGQRFKCHPWMLVQGQQFDKLYTAMRQNISMTFYGDTLINAVAQMIDRKLGGSK